jgi:hypothetical protein
MLFVSTHRERRPKQCRSLAWELLARAIAAALNEGVEALLRRSARPEASVYEGVGVNT